MKQRICSSMITSLCQSDHYSIFFSYSNLRERDSAVCFLEFLLESLYIQIYVKWIYRRVESCWYFYIEKWNYSISKENKRKERKKKWERACIAKQSRQSNRSRQNNYRCLNNTPDGILGITVNKQAVSADQHVSTLLQQLETSSWSMSAWLSREQAPCSC